MLRIVKPKTPHRLHILQSQRREQETNIRNLIRHLVFSKDLSPDNLGLLAFRDIRLPRGENGIAVICPAIFGQESDKSLRVGLNSCLQTGVVKVLTENEDMSG